MDIFIITPILFVGSITCKYSTLIVPTVIGALIPTYYTIKYIHQQKCTGNHNHNHNQLLKYWTIHGIYTVITSLTDHILYCVPFYSSAKVCILVYLWYPVSKNDKTGSIYIYNKFIVPNSQTIIEKTESYMKKLRKWIATFDLPVKAKKPEEEKEYVEIKADKTD